MQIFIANPLCECNAKFNYPFVPNYVHFLNNNIVGLFPYCFLLAYLDSMYYYIYYITDLPHKQLIFITYASYIFIPPPPSNPRALHLQMTSSKMPFLAIVRGDASCWKGDTNFISSFSYLSYNISLWDKSNACKIILFAIK